MRRSLAQAQEDHDALERVSNSMARRVAQLRRDIKRQQHPGLIGRILRHVRGLDEADLAAKKQLLDEASEQLAESEAALATMAAVESETAAKLAQVALAREHLAVLHEQRKKELLADKGSLGDEMRALDAASVQHAQTKSHLRELIGITEHAARAFVDILEAKRDLDLLPGGAVAAKLSTQVNHEQAMHFQRIQEHSPYVQQTLGDALRALDGSVDDLQGLSDNTLGEELSRLSIVQAAAIGSEASDNAIFIHAAAAASDLDTVVSVLSEMHIRIAREEEEIAERINARVEM